MESYTSPKYNYRLKNKYECLTSSESQYPSVHVADDVYACLNLYNDYTVEACLEKYEAIYGPTNIGFIGGTLERYENLTQPLSVIQASQNVPGSNLIDYDGNGPNSGGSSSNPSNNGGNTGGSNEGSGAANNGGSNGGSAGGIIGGGNGGQVTTDITNQEVIDFITAQI